MNCVTYNNSIDSCITGQYVGAIMYKCIICHAEFKKLACEKSCSKKCKIIEGSEILESGCWLYKRTTSGTYGKLRWKKKWLSAHRVAYEEFVGPVPEDKWVCHKCDTPKCVNPEHLFIGSPSDNRKDALRKKRVPIGELNHFSRFTNCQISEMRLLKSEGFSYSRLSRIFNCTITHLYNVVKNKIRKG